jgi:hypothetical protein
MNDFAMPDLPDFPPQDYYANDKALWDAASMRKFAQVYASQVLATREAALQAKRLPDGAQDWHTPCMVCGELPTLHPTGLCGPCCTGEEETKGGRW